MTKGVAQLHDTCVKYSECFVDVVYMIQTHSQLDDLFKSICFVSQARTSTCFLLIAIFHHTLRSKNGPLDLSKMLQ